LTLGGFSVDAGDLIYLNGAASTLQGTNQLLAGQTIFAVQIGWDEHGGNFLAPAAGAVAGDTFDLQVSWYRAGLSSLVETETFPGYIWDPVSGITALLERLRVLIATPAHDPMLDTILASVQRTYGV